MDDTERASQAINEWIHQERMLLKDGNPHGLHPRTKESLIKAVVAVMVAARGATPPDTSKPGPKPGMKAMNKPAKPRTAKQIANAVDDAE